MRKVISVSAAVLFLSTTSLSAQQTPGFLETAMFLITGKRANTFEKHNYTGGYIDNTKKFSMEKDNFQDVGLLYSVLGDPKQCGVSVYEFDGAIKSSENLDRPNVPIMRATVYLFNRLSGQYSLEPTRLLDGSISWQEKMSGEDSVCVHRFVGQEIKDKKCTNDMTFMNKDQSMMASRKRAWQYLVDNFCSGNNQPF